VESKSRFFRDGVRDLRAKFSNPGVRVPQKRTLLTCLTELQPVDWSTDCSELSQTQCKRVEGKCDNNKIHNVVPIYNTITVRDIHRSVQWTADHLARYTSYVATPYACDPRCVSISSRTSHNHKPYCPATGAGCTQMVQILSTTQQTLIMLTCM